MLGNLDEAIQKQKDAMTLANRLDAHLREKTKAHRYLADAYRMAKMKEDAKNEYNGAIDLLMKSFNNEETAQEELLIRGAILHGLGSLHLNYLNYGDANRYLQESMLIHLAADDKYHQGLDLNELGRLYMSLANYPIAEDRFENAYNLFKKGGRLTNPYYETAVLINRARLYLHRENYQEANHCAIRATEISKDFHFKAHLARAQALLAEINITNPEWTINEVVQCSRSAIQTSVDLHKNVADEILEKIVDLIKLLIRRDEPEKALELSNAIRNLESSDLLPKTTHARNLLQEKFTEVKQLSEHLRSTRAQSPLG